MVVVMVVILVKVVSIEDSVHEMKYGSNGQIE